MDVIGFLYISLGSSTLQLHDSLGSRRAWACSEASFSSQNGDSVTKEQCSVVPFCGQENSVQRIFIKKCFLFTVGSKSVRGWVEKFSKGRSKVADDARQDAEVAETTVKRLLCCGFQCTGKIMGQVYQCWWRICREVKVLSKFKYRIFYVLYQSVTYLLSLPRI
jgi:hypothetical protein